MAENIYNGIINIFKEKGFTSHDVVAKMRGILKQKKIGHSGTLDPDATGVLPVLLGNATVLSDMLTDKSKEYEAVMLLGVSTDTQDITGKILEKRDTSNLNKDMVKEVILSFLGEYMQLPPMYSALKVGGKKLVDLAREGKEVKREPRAVYIFDIDIMDISLPEVKFKAKVSKGTYIRTLCHDIGEKLSVGGCMESLIRTRVDRFYINDAITLKQVEENRECIKKNILSVEEYFSFLPKINTSPEFDKYLHNGNKLKLDKKPENSELYRLYDSKDRFIAIYKKEMTELKPFKMFL
ncbi:tRNA pseudouridine(55) synthase TruB [Lachnoanaerobaculum saburreum]|uniref:tRNA pseudouridine synthase B n=1 Tax=Lachnoanaerobaculum saburreum DSM 3986 TaxID=887325 RepID=E6LQ99_9FIRM|nr:tRNA pseudouridine(55) synthase TruB [Lachnoanaerobaculum saburreum]EFU76018.1 tRNA pseudouridine synthase B [Lachnoanaerobaculum saburreum DSM 3986]